MTPGPPPVRNDILVGAVCGRFAPPFSEQISANLKRALIPAGTIIFPVRAEPKLPRLIQRPRRAGILGLSGIPAGSAKATGRTAKEKVLVEGGRR